MKILIPLCVIFAIASAGTAKGRHPLLPVLPRVAPEGRITNGDLANLTQFPYQVGLSLDFEEFKAWCGGTLISDRWVLTAAHCTDVATGVTVYLGAIDINNSVEESQRRIYSGKENIFVHEAWDPNTITNDISLIKLPVTIKFNEYIQPATLPVKSDSYASYENELVWASGWGKDSDAATTVSQFLRYIQVPVLKQSTCAYYYLGLVSSKMICISGKEGRSVCSGDSGGPLVYKDGDINYVIGATSFGLALGCEAGWPGVFTRVTSYLDWIEETSGLVNLP